MKNKLYKIVFSCVLLTMFSCTDILDQLSTSSLSADGFYTSADNVEMALTACYADLQNQSHFTFQTLCLDAMADNAYDDIDYLSEMDIAQGPITSTIGGLVDGIYETMYDIIARCNLFLELVDEYTGDDLDDDTRTTWLAEVKTIRAWCYFKLYKYYGDVPLVTKVLTIEEKYQAKADASEILAQVNEDLDYAITYLPDQAYSNMDAHFVKSSAQVLKARVLLFDAYDDNGDAITSVMEEVKDLTEEIINKGYYSIATGYRQVFVDGLGEQQGNNEIIFSINYVEPNNSAAFSGSWSLCKCLLYTAEAPGGSIMPLSDLADEYEFTDGTSFSTDNPLYNADDKFENRDPRMALTMFNKTVTFEDGYEVTISESATGYSFWKFLDGEDAADYNSTSIDGSDWVSMRYAEVLLMYAEAANEVDGPTTAVHDAINQIRSREGVEMPDLDASLSKDEMRTAIRRERRIELAFEGFRYDDIKRWKIAEEELNMTASDAIITRYFEEKNYHFPLPNDEINANNGVLVQNPDYD